VASKPKQPDRTEPTSEPPKVCCNLSFGPGFIVCLWVIDLNLLKVNQTVLKLTLKCVLVQPYRMIEERLFSLWNAVDLFLDFKLIVHFYRLSR